MNSATAKQIESMCTSTDVDMDLLHILPLSIMSLYTAGLKQARLIKNMHFKSVIKIYKDAKTGNGQIEPDALIRHLGELKRRIFPPRAQPYRESSHHLRRRVMRPVPKNGSLGK